MFDFLRNLTKSAEEKRQETVAAYLDGALNGRSRQRFEQEMAQDDTLRQQVEQLRLIKQSLRQLPPRQVPRNFILNPADYPRPAPQPWVQAYPVLRTATAMAAFFFIFAIAASIFTSFGTAEQASLAPAADVAQSEQAQTVEITRIVTEVVIEEEPLAFEAADSVAVAEDEGAMDAEAAVSDAAEEEIAEEIAIEETIAEEAIPAEPETAESQDEAAEDGIASVPQATAAVMASTPTIPPTPTVSRLPRVVPPTPPPSHDMEEAQDDEMANDVVAGVSGAEAEAESAETTAVLPEDAVHETAVDQPINPLLWLQVGLGALLLLLAGLTFYARRQR